MTVTVTVTAPVHPAHGDTIAVRVRAAAPQATTAAWLLRFDAAVLTLRRVDPVPNAAARVTATMQVAQGGLVPVTLDPLPRPGAAFDAGFVAELEVTGPAGSSARVAARLVSVTTPSGTHTSAWTSERVVVAPEPLQTPYGLEVALPATTTGSPYLYRLQASGGVPPYHWWSPRLPEGLRLLPDGTLLGQASAPSSPGGPTTFELALTDSDLTPASGSLGAHLTVGVGPLSLRPMLTKQIVSCYPDAAFEAVGGTPPFTFTATGLPPGMAIDPHGGELVGAPQQVGVFDVRAAVSDAAGQSAQVTCPVPVDAVNGDHPLETGWVPGGVDMVSAGNLVPQPYLVTVRIGSGAAVPPPGLPLPTMRILVDGAEAWSGLAKDEVVVPLNGRTGGPHRITVALEGLICLYVPYFLRFLQVATAPNHPRPSAPASSDYTRPVRPGGGIGPGKPFTVGSGTDWLVQFPGSADDLAISTAAGVELVTLAGDHTVAGSTALTAPAMDCLVVANPGCADGQVVLGRDGSQVVALRHQSDGSWVSAQALGPVGLSAVGAALGWDGEPRAVAGAPTGVTVVTFDGAGSPAANACGQAVNDDIRALRAESLDDGSIRVTAANRMGDCVGQLAWGPGGLEGGGTPTLRVQQVPRQPVALTVRPAALPGPVVLCRGAGQAVAVAPAGRPPITLGGHPELAVAVQLSSGMPTLVTSDNSSMTVSFQCLDPTATPVRLRVPAVVRSLVVARGNLGVLAVLRLDDHGEIGGWVNPAPQPFVQVRPSVLEIASGTTERVLIGNAGGRPLTVHAVTLVGPVSGSCQLDAVALPASVAAGDVLGVGIGGTAGSGAANGAVLIDTDDPLYPRVVIPLTLQA